MILESQQQLKISFLVCPQDVSFLVAESVEPDVQHFQLSEVQELPHALRCHPIVRQVQIMQRSNLSYGQSSLLSELVRSNVQVTQFWQLLQKMHILICDGILGQRELCQLTELTDVSQGLTGNLVAPYVEALQMLQPRNMISPLITDLVVVDEELAQVAKTSAQCVKPNVSYFVLPQNQCLDSTKTLHLVNVLVCHLMVRQVYLLCIVGYDQLLHCCCSWSS